MLTKESIKKLQELVDENNLAMMVTASNENDIESRPMMTQKVDDQGTIWFFTSDDTGKVADLMKNRSINLAYSHPGKNKFMSVTGRGELVKDQKMIDELWSKILEAWYPKGKNDPSLALIKVRPQIGKYWDGSSWKIVELFHIAKALVTDTEYNSGEMGTLN